MKVTVAYQHDPADFAPIYLAIVAPAEPVSSATWLPAYRDTVEGVPVVWVKTDYPAGHNIWIKDKTGTRKAIKL